MSKAKDKPRVAYTWEDYLATLFLQNGVWAINTPSGVYVFPPETTKEEAIKVLQKAYEYNTYKYN